MTPEVRLADLVWQPAGADAPTLDLRGVRLHVPAGGLLVVEGRSGAGKTTLLRALAGLLGTLLPGDLRGELTVGGVDLVAAAGRLPGPPVDHLAGLGLLPAGPAPANALPRLLDDAALPLEARRFRHEAMAPAILAAAGRAGLATPLLERGVGDLSGGERIQAAALVALVAGPSLLLADEPFAGLDAGAAAHLRATLLAERATRIIAVHDAGEVGDPSAQVLRIGAPATRVRVAVRDRRPRELPAHGHGDARPVLQAIRIASRARSVSAASFALFPGEPTLLEGATGSGKSTLLALAAGVLPADEGERLVDPHQRIRLVPQDPGLLLGARPAAERLARGERPAAERLARALDVAHLLDVPPGRCSDGERRRLALVVALAASPTILVADEPTAGLDDERAATVARLLDECAAAGAALLVATHDPRLYLQRERRLLHPAETAAPAAAPGSTVRLPAPAAVAVDAAQQLLSPALPRRLLGTANPLTRAGLALFWFALSLLSPTTLVAQGAIALPVLLVAWLSGVELLATLRLAAALAPAIAGLVLANLLGGASGEEAVGAGARLVAFAAGSLVLLRPFEPLRLADAAIEWLRAPFAATMALLATAATIPAMRAEARERRAIRRLSRSAADPLLFVDTFDALVRAVPALAIALEIRGVRITTRTAPPTRLRPSGFGRADALLVAASAGGLLVSVVRAIADAILAP